MTEDTTPTPASVTSQAPPSEAAISGTTTLPTAEPSTQNATASTSPDTSKPAVAEPTEDAPPMTKSAMKRQRRQELYESQKLVRRAKEKEKKKSKAAEKRKMIEEGVIEKPERKKRKKGEFDSDGKKVEYGARIVIDVGFDELMNEKEVKSMNSQVAYCYAANRNATHPFPILVSAFSGRLKAAYDKRDDHLHWKGVEWWEEGFEKLYEAEEAVKAGGTVAMDASSSTLPTSEEVEEARKVKLGVFAGQPRSVAPKSSVIYLTGDSPNVLTSIDPNHTYVLGGIVDRNRYKALCLNKANELGIQHAQLPIGQYLPEMATRKVLTVNQVFEIAVNWVESVRERKEKLREEGKSEVEIEKAEGDWRQALRKVMPERKFDKDGRAKKRAEKKAEKQRQNPEGVFIVEVDDESEDDEEMEETFDDDTHQAVSVSVPDEEGGKAVAEPKAEQTETSQTLQSEAI